MFFHIRDLELRPAKFDVELAQGQLEFLDPKIRQTGTLHASGKADLASVTLGEIRVKGHVNVAMEAECDRCLEAAPVTVDSDFELLYRPGADGMGDEKEIDDDESEMGFYDGDGVELEEVLREFVLLALPMQRLCRADCKGICPACGQNRNLKECSCQQTSLDDRWAALKHLKN